MITEDHVIENVVIIENNSFSIILCCVRYLHAEICISLKVLGLNIFAVLFIANEFSTLNSQIRKYQLNL